MNLVERAKTYATEKHTSTNHEYAGRPYTFHLNMVAEAANRHIAGFSQHEQELILAGCWCHDVIEDARETYNDVKGVLGEEVAEIAYALTNEKGRSRAERADDRYYSMIKANDLACIVKVADRVANATFSRSQGSRMFDIYRQEYQNFKSKLYTPGKFESIWQELEGLFSSELSQ